MKATFIKLIYTSVKGLFQLRMVMNIKTLYLKLEKVSKEALNTLMLACPKIAPDL